MRRAVALWLAVLGLGCLCLQGCFGGDDSSEEAAAPVLSVAEVASQDATGTAVHLGETVTVEGIVTVSAGVLANKKLKVFIQDGINAVMVFHENGAAVIPPGEFSAGDRVRVTGVVTQTDLTGDNPATGTVRVDISNGSWQVLSTGNALPAFQAATLADIAAGGNTYEGELVCVLDVHKTAGAWPVAGDKTTSVTVSDGVTEMTVRFEKNTIDAELADKLAVIGNGDFTLTGLVVQNDLNGDGDLLDDFQVWPRGADDIVEPIELLREEDGGGTALRLGETVTAVGVVTVASKVLFDAKFEVFIQDDTGALMLLHDSIAALGVDVLPGDLVWARGVVAQTDGSGQPLNGTVRLDLNAGGTVQILDTGRALPAAQPITLAQYLDTPADYEGELIRINGASRTAGAWPAVGVKGSITISDDSGGPGVPTVKLAIQKGANTADLTGTADPFDVVGIAIQNGASWEIWIRSAGDVNP